MIPLWDAPRVSIREASTVSTSPCLYLRSISLPTNRCLKSLLHVRQSEGLLVLGRFFCHWSSPSCYTSDAPMETLLRHLFLGPFPAHMSSARSSAEAFTLCKVLRILVGLFDPWPEFIASNRTIYSLIQFTRLQAQKWFIVHVPFAWVYSTSQQRHFGSPTWHRTSLRPILPDRLSVHTSPFPQKVGQPKDRKLLTFLPHPFHIPLITRSAFLSYIYGKDVDLCERMIC